MELQDVTVSSGFRFHTSRCLDLVCALHLVIDSSHHGFAEEWASSIRENLRNSEEFRIISEMPLQGLELCNMTSLAGDLDDVDGFIETLSSMSCVELVYWLLQERVPLLLIRECVEGRRSPGSLLPNSRPGYPGGEWISRVIRDGARFRLALTRMLTVLKSPVESLCGSLYEFHLSTAKALLAHVVSANKDLSAVLTDLAGEAPSQSMGDTVHCLIVSWFASPHRLRWSDLHRDFVVPDWQEVVSGLESDRARSLKRVVGALADANRLIIMRELARSRASGRALAPRLGLTPATMSHHLDVLVSAGLVTREEVGNAQFYATDLSAVDAAIREIQDYLKYNPRQNRS